MWPVDTAFLAGLTGSHGLATVAKTYFDGAETGTLSIDPGSVVRVSARSQRRRSARLVLSEAQWTDLLAPTGVEVRIWSTIVVGTYTHPLVPAFTGRVERRRRARRTGLIGVECWDRFADVNDDAFDVPRPAPEGTRIASAIADLLLETHPDATVTDLTTSNDTIPGGLTWDAGDGARGRAIDRMALSIGAEVVALPDGNFVIRPTPTLTDTAVWSIATGPGGVVIADAREESRTGVANRWVVTGNASAAGQSVREVVTLDSGPLRFAGPYGRVTRTYTDPMITTSAQAYTAGLAILARVQGLARQRTVDVVTNVALEAGDVLSVSTEDGTERHLADEFDVALTPDQPTMSIASRSEAD